MCRLGQVDELKSIATLLQWLGVITRVVRSTRDFSNLDDSIDSQIRKAEWYLGVWSSLSVLAEETGPEWR